MIKSMTGYGEAEYQDERLRINVMVKSINAKYADINFRLPKAFSAKEIAWRNLAIAYLERGNVTLSATYERKNTISPQTGINLPLFKDYYRVLESLAKEVGASSRVLFQLALQAPEVFDKASKDIGSKEDYQALEKVIQAALKQCDESRKVEGAALTKKLLVYLKTIQKSLKKVEKIDTKRRERIRKKLQESVKPWITTHAVNEDRFEQELIYYLERLDITEEKVRLTQHLAYFKKVMKNTHAVGKKLGFIAQEMGREINTIGAKANDVAIQKEVIGMKDELEKIKEQLQNIL